MLATRNGKCIRFRSTTSASSAAATSTGVRGIRLADGDEVIGMSMLRHVEADADERAAYLRQANAERRAAGEEASSDEAPDPDAEVSTNIALSPERYEELRGKEEFILTVSERGFGKRTSAYEYRVTGRGGQGIGNIEMNERNGPVVAIFPGNG